MWEDRVIRRMRAYVRGAEISLASILRKIATEVKRGMGKDMERKKEKCLEDFETFYWVGWGGGGDYRIIRTRSSPSCHSVCAV
jgi:hypothetical protein